MSSLKLKFTVILVLHMCVSCANYAIAQTHNANGEQNSTPEQRAKIQNDLMKSKLQLTTDQYQKVSVLNLEYAKKIQPIIASDASKLTKVRKAKSILKEKDEKLKIIFTAAQYKLYHEIVKKKLTDFKKNYSK